MGSEGDADNCDKDHERKWCSRPVRAEAITVDDRGVLARIHRRTFADRVSWPVGTGAGKPRDARREVSRPLAILLLGLSVSNRGDATFVKSRVGVGPYANMKLTTVP